MPTGAIVAHPARGLFMGNRGGRLHDAGQRLGRARWRSRRWIICALDFRNRHRQVMSVGYTELFFLDEVTALAAGHRPCFECRRTEALAYRAAFPGAVSADEMDTCLHTQRRAPPPLADPRSLPDGAMLRDGARFLALRHGRALPWAFTGYGPPEPLPRHPCPVLTPAATLAALSAAYRPVWHPSVRP